MIAIKEKIYDAIDISTYRIYSSCYKFIWGIDGFFFIEFNPVMPMAFTEARRLKVMFGDFIKFRN